MKGVPESSRHGESDGGKTEVRGRHKREVA